MVMLIYGLISKLLNNSDYFPQKGAPLHSPLASILYLYQLESFMA